MTPDIIALLPELAKGGAGVILTAVLVWITIVQNRRMDTQDKNHRSDFKDLMDGHTAERKEWVANIERATDKFARSTTDQGDRIARAIEDALRRSRP